MKILRNNTYSDKEPTIRIGHWRNKKKFSELTDRQLKNIANYEKGKKDLYKNHPKYVLWRDYLKPTLVGGSVGATIGAGKGKLVKGAGIGALSGAAFSIIVNHSGNKLHLKHAEYARKELEKRNKNN